MHIAYKPTLLPDDSWIVPDDFQAGLGQSNELWAAIRERNELCSVLASNGYLEETSAFNS